MKDRFFRSVKNVSMMKVQQDIIGTSALNNKQMELNCTKDGFKTIFYISL